jgi:hypothetical protein
VADDEDEDEDELEDNDEDTGDCDVGEVLLMLLMLLLLLSASGAFLFRPAASPEQTRRAMQHSNTMSVVIVLRIVQNRRYRGEKATMAASV